jgi:hypothetical protein
MTEPTEEQIEASRWAAWKNQLGYVLHSEHGWGRDAATVHVERTSDNWRRHYLAGKSPEDAARIFRGKTN